GIRDFHVTGVQTCALPISFSIFATVPLTVQILTMPYESRTRVATFGGFEWTVQRGRNQRAIRGCRAEAISFGASEAQADGQLVERHVLPSARRVATSRALRSTP